LTSSIPPIDESTAWDLIRGVPPGALDHAESHRVYHDSSLEVWLQVHRSGHWTVSHTPTDAASDLFDLFLPLQIRTDLAIAQIGQSLDGRIATASGQSHYVTGPADIRRLHRLRALVDAVVVGAETVASDDPSLTVREVEGLNPVRVVIDPSGRLSPSSRVFSDGSARTLWVRAVPGAEEGARHVEAEAPPTGVDIVWLPASDESRIAPRRVLGALRELELRRVLVEGGATTVSGFLEAGVLDRLHVTVAPVLIGSGPTSLRLAPIEHLDQALRPTVRQFRLGRDTLYDLDLR
jgi:diaminohydroxyphosphoribosylaminopyrimidine deaminase/5-amino-6-(5-phosphoribosylamino)uracil reductase